jgi:pyridinium-3,5-bisthiocarboxylic acid mononucleotide nickel chelatase
VRVGYFDCIAGISGDMALGALIDAGADFEEVRSGLGSLPLEPFDVDVQEVERHGIHALQVVVTPSIQSVIRTYSSIRALLDASDLPPRAVELAQRIFRRLAEVEARIHRKEVDLVTFHEIGAIDSIVDIAGVSLALTMLGVERCFSSAVPTGMGLVKTDHGATPIPAPAVVELLRGAPLYSRGVPVELVTPTGAAILAATVDGYGELPPMRLGSTGYGAGTHELDFPNVLRIMIGEEPPVAAAAALSLPSGTEEVVLQTNVDDVTPELSAHVVEQLLAAGAQDAWLTPIVMKKGRAAVTVSVLVSPDRVDEIRRILFTETGTLGIRATPVVKTALERSLTKVETAHGVVGVKLGFLDGRLVALAPEYEDCARVAREAGVPAREVYGEALRLARGEHPSEP